MLTDEQKQMVYAIAQGSNNASWEETDEGINIKGNIRLSLLPNFKSLEEIPFKFNIIYGSFAMVNSNIRSLRNAPNQIHGTFFCQRNDKLESLEGCPEYVEKWNLQNCPNIQTFEPLKNCNIKRAIMISPTPFRKKSTKFSEIYLGSTPPDIFQYVPKNKIDVVETYGSVEEMEKYPNLYELSSLIKAKY